MLWTALVFFCGFSQEKMEERVNSELCYVALYRITTSFYIERCCKLQKQSYFKYLHHCVDVFIPRINYTLFAENSGAYSARTFQSPTCILPLRTVPRNRRPGFYEGGRVGVTV